MTTLTIHIDSEHSALVEDCPQDELRRIIKKCVDKIGYSDYGYSSLYDYNGNKVGHVEWNIEPEDDDE